MVSLELSFPDGSENSKAKAGSSDALHFSKQHLKPESSTHPLQYWTKVLVLKRSVALFTDIIAVAALKDKTANFSDLIQKGLFLIYSLPLPSLPLAGGRALWTPGSQGLCYGERKRWRKFLALSPLAKISYVTPAHVQWRLGNMK